MVERTPGPFEYYNEIHPGVTGDTIRADAEDPGLDSDTVAALSSELEGDAKDVGTQMSGDITAEVQKNPSTLSGEAATLAAAGFYAVGLIKKFAGMVDTFDTTVNGLNWSYRTQLATAMRWAGRAAAYTEDTADDKLVTEAHLGPEVKSYLQPDYNKAVNQLDDDADTVAADFKKGLDNDRVKALIRAGLIPLSAAVLYPGLNLSTADRTAYHKTVMKDMTPQERRDYILAHEEIPAEVLDGLLADDDATRKLIGDHVATEVKDLDDDSDEDDVNAVNDLLDRFSQSDEASAGIINALGGHGLIEAYALSSARLFSTGEADQKFIQLLRTVFRAGEPTLAGHDPQASRQVAKDMVGEIRDMTDGEGGLPEHSYDLGNSIYGLSYLLKDSTLSTEFLDTMGDELDDYERNVMSPNRMSWRMMSSVALGAGAPFDDDDFDSAFDPMSSYMSALGNNDEAALQFFTAGGENSHDASGDDRQDYWIGHRYWGHDDFDGLTAALDAATTGTDNLDDPTTARQAADLMSHTVDELANRSEVDWGTDGEGFEPGDVSDDGTQRIAHMLTTYMSAVDAALEDPKAAEYAPGVTVLSDARFGEGLANMPKFAASELKEMANVAVSSEGGFNDMRQGLSAYQGMQLQNSIDAHGRIDDETSNADARLEGFFVNAVGDTNIDDAADKDARVQSWIDMGKDVAGAIPVPGGSVVEFLASQAIDAGAQELSDHYTNNEDAEVDSSNNYAVAAQDARHEAAEQALVNSGVITPSEIAAQLTAPEGSPYTTAEVESWFPDGRFPTPEEFAALDPDTQADIRGAVDSVITDRNLQNTTDYDQTYKLMFSGYFEKGDGDGN